MARIERGPLHYTVIATLQSPGNEPVEMRWYGGPDKLAAVLAVGGNIELGDDSPYYVLVSVRIDVTESESA